MLEYSDEEIEQVRVKAVGEEGYIEPRIKFKSDYYSFGKNNKNCRNCN